eukprot:66723_1
MSERGNVLTTEDMLSASRRRQQLEFLKGIAKDMRESCSPLSIKDRRWRIWSYRTCFVGSESIDWLERHKSMSRETGLTVMTQMFEEKMIHHVANKQPFRDGNFFYRFRTADELCSIRYEKAKKWSQVRKSNSFSRSSRSFEHEFQTNASPKTFPRFRGPPAELRKRFQTVGANRTRVNEIRATNKLLARALSADVERRRPMNGHTNSAQSPEVLESERKSHISPVESFSPILPPPSVPIQSTVSPNQHSTSPTVNWLDQADRKLEKIASSRRKKNSLVRSRISAFEKYTSPPPAKPISETFMIELADLLRDTRMYAHSIISGAGGLESVQNALPIIYYWIRTLIERVTSVTTPNGDGIRRELQSIQQNFRDVRSSIDLFSSDSGEIVQALDFKFRSSVIRPLQVVAENLTESLGRNSLVLDAKETHEEASKLSQTVSDESSNSVLDSTTQISRINSEPPVNSRSFSQNHQENDDNIIYSSSSDLHISQTEVDASSIRTSPVILQQHSPKTQRVTLNGQSQKTHMPSSNNMLSKSDEVSTENVTENVYARPISQNTDAAPQAYLYRAEPDQTSQTSRSTSLSSSQSQKSSPKMVVRSTVSKISSSLRRASFTLRKEPSFRKRFFTHKQQNSAQHQNSSNPKTPSEIATNMVGDESAQKSNDTAIFYDATVKNSDVYSTLSMPPDIPPKPRRTQPRYPISKPSLLNRKRSPSVHHTPSNFMDLVSHRSESSIKFRSSNCDSHCESGRRCHATHDPELLSQLCSSEPSNCDENNTETYQSSPEPSIRSLQCSTSHDSPKIVIRTQNELEASERATSIQSSGDTSEITCEHLHNPSRSLRLNENNAETYHSSPDPSIQSSQSSTSDDSPKIVIRTQNELEADERAESIQSSRDTSEITCEHLHNPSRSLRLNENNAETYQPSPEPSIQSSQSSTSVISQTIVIRTQSELEAGEKAASIQSSRDTPEITCEYMPDPSTIESGAGGSSVTTGSVLSDDTLVHSDDTLVHSDDTLVHSDDTLVHSDDTLVHSDDTLVHSDDTLVHSSIESSNLDFKSLPDVERWMSSRVLPVLERLRCSRSADFYISAMELLTVCNGRVPQEMAFDEAFQSIVQ